MANQALAARRGKSARLDLQKRRKDRGVTLESIAENTKISIRFLKAIEDGDFKQLPGGIFDTSYLRQYAAAVGLDEKRLLEAYSAATNPLDAGQSEKEAPANRGILRWLGIATTTVR